MTRAAVLGTGSMLGRELTRRLRAEGVELVGVGRSDGDDVALDLGAPLAEEAGRNLRADLLFHCASAFAGDDFDGLHRNLATNVLGCAAVLELADRLGCSHLVYAGSISSVEGFDPAGRSGYGLSKALAEQVLQWGMERRGGRFCSVRLAQLYDTQGDCCRHQPWIGRIVAYASRGLDLHLPPSAGPRNFLHVEDAARMVAQAASEGLTGTWLACHEVSLSLEEIAELAFAEFGRGGRVVIDTDKTPLRRVEFPDGSALRERLGGRPLLGMAEGFARIHRAGTAPRFGPMDVQ